jgi:hypothetical protein
MLTVVRPPSAGQGTRAPKGRRSPALSLTDGEATRRRAALRNLHALHGPWPKLAEAMGVKPELLHNIIGGQNHSSPAVAPLAARAAGSTVDRLLGAPVFVDRGEPRGASKGAP